MPPLWRVPRTACRLLVAAGLLMSLAGPAAAQAPERVRLRWNPPQGVPILVTTRYSYATLGGMMGWSESIHRLVSGMRVTDGLEVRLLTLDDRAGAGRTEAEATAAALQLPRGGVDQFEIDATGAWYTAGDDTLGPGRVRASPLEIALEFPRVPTVAVGDEWSFSSVVRSGKQVAFLLTRDATARLESVVSHGGRWIAFVSVKGTYSWSGKGGFAAAGEERFTQSVLWDLDGEYPIAIRGESSGFSQPPPTASGPVARVEVRSRTQVDFAPEHNPGSTPAP